MKAREISLSIVAFISKQYLKSIKNKGSLHVTSKCIFGRNERGSRAIVFLLYKNRDIPLEWTVLKTFNWICFSLPKTFFRLFTEHR